MGAPFFSVVIPTHNRAELLEEAVRSVLNQGFADFELIVVDDFSTDRTRRVVEAFKDGRIRYMQNQRKAGGAGARNSGVIRAKGRWIAFLDDDDLWFPEKLEKQYAAAKTAGADTGLIYSGFFTSDDTGRKISVLPLKDGWMREDLLYRNWIGTFSTVILRKEVLAMAGGLDEEFPSMQDMELYVRVASVSRIQSIREPLAFVRGSGRDRISGNWQCKAQGSYLFWKKYGREMAGCPRLKHITASRVFIFALRQRDFLKMTEAAPWTLAGAYAHPRHFLKTLWGAMRSILPLTRSESE